MSRSLSVSVAIVACLFGFCLRGWVGGDAVDHDHHEDHADEAGDHDDHDDHEEEEEPHIALTQRAFETLRLQLAEAQIADYVRTTAIPAQVAEFPGVSALKLAAPVHGVVTAVAAEPGVSVEPGDPLFELQITDERVLDAQLQLIEALTRLRIVGEELDRLAPLAASGAVAGSRRRDLAYEQRELETAIHLRRDELVVRGLPADRVDQLMDELRLARTVVVRVPDRVDQLAGGAKPSPVRAVAWREGSTTTDLSIENLLVQPGETVERGQALADVAAHSQLYLRVMAFERDVPLLARLAANGATLSAEFGHTLEDHAEASSLVTGLRVRYVGNHVEPGTQTYACYVPLENELLNESVGPTGRRYRTWRFSVGQRAHLLLPTEAIEGHITLPIDAVAVEGPNAYVFRRHEHEEPPHAWPDAHKDQEEHEDEAYAELEPVAVTLLHRDTRHAVVATGGDLRVGDEIAMNAAYQLLIALEADAGGGHGHHHHHDH